MENIFSESYLDLVRLTIIHNQSHWTHVHSHIYQVILTMICYNRGMRQINQHHNHQRTQLCYIT